MKRGLAYRLERGFSLVAAIFLLVVLASLATFAVRLGVGMSESASLAQRAAEARQAAMSGVSWAAYRAVNEGWCGEDSLTLEEGAAAGFRVEVSCSASTHSEAGASLNVYVIGVTADSGRYGTPDYVSRRLEVKVTDDAS